MRVYVVEGERTEQQCTAAEQGVRATRYFLSLSASTVAPACPESPLALPLDVPGGTCA